MRRGGPSDRRIEMRIRSPTRFPWPRPRALAQRLLEPYWAGFDNKNDSDKAITLLALAPYDPLGVLQKLDGVEFPTVRMKSTDLAILWHGHSQKATPSERPRWPN